MATSPDNVSMALFCDFENVALGVRDAKYEKFDIKLVLERLLLKGSIVVKKAYCDWERYKGFKAGMHEANFELIEIPHVRQSGKNSADIRLVVDALDLCYTKSHVNTFVIISGDSDFSPLVSKLRENAKQVIGVGVKQSTSDLLIANCDEFIFYDDLVRETRQAVAKREPKEAQPQVRRSPEEEKRRREELEARRSRAVDMAVETFDALLAERGDTGKIWASVLKDAIKRRKPDFSETRFGFKAFGNLLDEAQSRGLLEVGRDEKSGTYVYRRAGAPVATVHETAVVLSVEAPAATVPVFAEVTAEKPRRAPKGRRSKPAAEATSVVLPEQVQPVVIPAEEAQTGAAKRGRGRRGARSETEVGAVEPTTPAAGQEAVAVPAPAVEAAAPPVSSARPERAKRKTARPVKVAAVEAATAVVPPPGDEARKSAPRARRPRKKAETTE
ncbi:NYN domain-containing protein [Zoogloea sp. LCSB751]|uniref:NYN domain-containing protein n=1 Tax=Zoogloea sp. LCSB751 TaxID=1965277 RepID=UPI0009A551C4|nr:NYN domain-containing protein [Zoogloea sp. LCSB751]